MIKKCLFRGCWIGALITAVFFIGYTFKLITNNPLSELDLGTYLWLFLIWVGMGAIAGSIIGLIIGVILKFNSKKKK